MNPSVLTVYQCPYPKIRLGKDYDGGYIIADVPGIKYNLLLAGGIKDDISFEEDFVKKYGVTCFAFDGTIDKLPNENNRIKFMKKNIGFSNNEILTNLHGIINKRVNIFVKMDIEGHEIPWIESLRLGQLNKFNQIVIEFHRPFTDKEINIFNKLNINHNLIHFHGNNCCGTRIHNNVVIPNIFECTYVHKKHFSSPPRLNTDTIPSVIDMKNVRSMNDIHISHPPFVN